MKLFTIIIAALLLIGHLNLESGEIIEHAFPKSANTYINPFLDKSYHFPVWPGQPEGIILKWWVKEICNDLLWVIVFFCISLMAYRISFRLFRVCFAWFWYHVIDHALLWWNYRSSYWFYWFIVLSYIICTLVIFLPEKKQGRVKSMV